MRKKSKKAISSILVLFVLFQIVCPVSSYAIENGGQETQETTNESLVMDENTGKDEDNSAQDSSKDEENIVVMAAHQSEDYKYLSDLDYITENNWSYAGWGEIKKDKNIENGQISLLVDGTRVYFSKGMGAHASSQLTYDVSGFSGTYTRFVPSFEAEILNQTSPRPFLEASTPILETNRVYVPEKPETS